MYRALSVERIFDIMAARDFNGATMTVGLSVRDSFLPTNGGRRVLAFRRGAARLVPCSRRTDVEVRLDVAEFSSLIVGAVRFRSLYDFGMVRVSEIALVDSLDQLFAVRSGPVCLTHF
jgi:predicted acetyltransferase